MINLNMQGDFPDNSLQAVLGTGLGTLSQHQQITFAEYQRVVLPVDGYVFWVKNPNKAAIEVAGSFHYQTDQKQQLDKTIAYQNVIFTTQNKIADFDDIQPYTIWIGVFGDLQFSFSSHGNYYEQANLWHYRGQAVYPEMRTQVIDNIEDIPTDPIITNSLPIWLALGTPQMPVYPSFLVPENISPPYVVAHIGREDTKALQPIQLRTPDYNLYQLAMDRVRLIVYGMNNQTALNFVQSIYQYCELNPVFGFLQSGITVSDGKHIQSEINAIAQQKEIVLEISYCQQAVYTAAIQYILKATATFTPRLI